MQLPGFVAAAAMLFCFVIEPVNLEGEEMSLPAVSSMFSDNMVLQRGKRLPVWGTAAAGETVEVSCAGQNVTARANENGQWTLFLNPIEEPGPHAMTVVNGDRKREYSNILVGDVFLCSGQSNMQWPVHDLDERERKEALAALNKNIRLYQFPKEGKENPARHAEAQWKRCDEEHAEEFSAVGLLFAQELRRHHDVPIGLIDSSYGGTLVETWMSKGFLAEHYPEEELRDALFGWPPSSMFNSMIAPVIPFPVKGVLWYQGESNAGRPAQYRRLLPGLIEDWRARWKEELPFFIVQLPNFSAGVEGKHFTWLREAQWEVAQEIPDVHVAVTYDTADGYDLHPKEKKEIAKRLALLARRHLYGEAVTASGPVFRSKEKNNGLLRLHFNHAGDGLVTPPGEELKGFAIAGKYGVFRYTQGSIDGESVLLRVPESGEPYHVRYAWEGNPAANLYNAEGLPAAPFRTDSFPSSDVEIELLPPPHFVELAGVEVLVDGDGCLRSMRAGGREFIHFSPPNFRGGAFQTLFGPARLFHLEKTGPRILKAGNETGSVRYHFFPGKMEMTLKNTGREEVPYWLPLADGVQAAALENGDVKLSAQESAPIVRGDMQLETDHPLQREFLKVHLRPGETKVLVLLFPTEEQATKNHPEEQSANIQ